MEGLKNKKNILVLGLGISGISTVKLLNTLNKKIYIYDKKNIDDLKDNLSKIKNIDFKGYFGGERPKLNKIDLVIKSPGMPPNEEIIKDIKKANIEIISDIELAYILSESKNFVAITGTNGKTTVTTLIYEILANTKKNVVLGGNIGVAILDNILKSNKDDVILVEASSFQLNDVISFKPKIAIITNIGLDHLDWHGSIENYQNAKKKIYKNQNENDFLILDYDDNNLKLLKNIKSNIFYYSIEHELDKGIFIKDDNIVIKDNSLEYKLLNIKDIKLYGKHNLKNVLSAVASCYLMGISLDVIKDTIIKFEGVEHRLELVDIIDGVKYINDSKGTNIESTIVAIKSFKEDKILILGGKDEGANFDILTNNIDSTIKHIILYGETKYLIEKSLSKKDINKYTIVSNLKEAIKLAYNLATKEDVVLFSPACASYDMFSNYMQRGITFKKEVLKLKGV